MGALWGKEEVLFLKSDSELKKIADGEFQSVQVAGTSSHITGKYFWILNTFKSSKKNQVKV